MGWNVYLYSGFQISTSRPSGVPTTTVSLVNSSGTPPPPSPRAQSQYGMRNECAAQRNRSLWSSGAYEARIWMRAYTACCALSVLARRLVRV